MRAHAGAKEGDVRGPDRQWDRFFQQQLRQLMILKHSCTASGGFVSVSVIALRDLVCFLSWAVCIAKMFYFAGSTIPISRYK